jgi:ribA/ribD-fused uncharacterized protein
MTESIKWYGPKIEGRQLPIMENLHKIDFSDDIHGKEIIEDLRGKYNWLSNFYPCQIIYDGQIFPSTEHAYQANKTENPLWRETIRVSPTPAIAKRKGAKAPLRPDWENIKDSIMLDVLRLKFQDTTLRDKLLETYPKYIIEGNVWHDNHFGVCLLEDCHKCRDKKGKNVLGHLLMKIREEIIVAIAKDEISIIKKELYLEKEGLSSTTHD